MQESVLLFAKDGYKLYYFPPTLVEDGNYVGIETGKFVFTNGEIKFELEMEEALFVVHAIQNAARMDFDLSTSMHKYGALKFKEKERKDNMFS